MNQNQEEIPKDTEEAIAAEKANENIQKQEVAKDPFAAGRERMDKIGSFFNKMKDKASQITSTVGAKMSRFFSKAKTFGGYAVAATLSAPELTQQAYDVTTEKAKQVDQWMGDKAEQVGHAIGTGAAAAGHAAVETGKFVGNVALDTGAVIVGGAVLAGKAAVEGTVMAGKAAYEAVDSGMDYLAQKGEQVGVWVEKTGDQFVDSVGKNVEKAKNFTIEKAQQAKDIAVAGGQIAQMIAFLAKENTIEGFNATKDAVAKQYNNVKTYGENAIASAKYRFAEAKKSFREGLNNFRMRRINSMLQKIEQNGNADPMLVEKFNKLSKSVIEKTQLMQDLEMVA